MLCEVCEDIFANPGARGQVSILFKAFYQQRYIHHRALSRSGMLNFVFGTSDTGWKTVSFDILAADGKSIL